MNTIEEYEESNAIAGERFFKQTFCVDNFYESLNGNYFTNTEKSQIL